ncbi:MAG TPA: hypothetical protein VLM89_12680 [Phycisphaerae bacterium]|nr:hypothetical protein [Phycisphaerae bacterium]
MTIRMRSALSLGAMILVSIGGGGLMAAEPAAIDIGSRLELFVDHYLIDGMKDAELRLHSPVPREIVFTFDKPWEGGLSAYASIIKDGDQYRLYYRGGGDLVREYTCLALSKDGVTWERPTLGLIEFEGSKDNNIFWTGKDKAYCESHNFAPFIDANPEAKPNERYKAVTVTRIREGPDSRKNVLLALVSADGIHWRKLRQEPIITEGAFDSHNTIFWDTTQNQYVCYLRAGQKGKKSVARTTSKDFIHWTQPELLDFGDTVPEHLYTNGIIPYFRAPHILLGFPLRFIHPKDRNKIGLEQRETDGFSDAIIMSSRDGLKWDRTFMEAFIRPGPDPLNWGGAHGNITPAWGIVPANQNEISIYWADHYDNYPKKDLIPRLWRGTVRTDGFISVNCPYRGGEMVTKPLLFKGKNLVINFATSAPGSVKVEIQDASGKPIPGYALADCIEFWGDEIERIVAWKGGTDVSKLSGKPVRLRFAMHDADLYSIRFR